MEQQDPKLSPISHVNTPTVYLFFRSTNYVLYPAGPLYKT